MSKRTVFTTLTALPPGISRQTVMETLHCHVEMIDLNPLVEERHPIKPPPNATPEEYHCQWYSLTDRVSYLPGGLVSGKVSYNACFHDLEMGLQTHCYAPMGLNIKGKWTLGGSLPGEPVGPVELGIGAPLHGLWLREDVDMKCNIMMTSFVKKTLKKAHSSLVDRLVVKAQIVGASASNQRISISQAPTQYSPVNDYSDYGDSQSVTEEGHGSPRPSQLSLSLLSSQEFRNNDNTDRASYNGSLYPRPLSVRSSGASHTGSVTGSQNGRVSWQNLKTSGTPPVQQAESAYVPYHASSQPLHAELPSNNGQMIGAQELPNLPHDRSYHVRPNYGAAELE